ncbi:hypothetical protein LTR97_012807 [Elasticomyces elasticus]|uniref:Uncharacterized protein n=1 Tax=Elasticomyces elasticus TaxID=574655 RepID=A0AAN7ZKH8_9PEZI|nr:hypothetical protein LTR97_012807 [Elasticomyces elasticus]
MIVHSSSSGGSLRAMVVTKDLDRKRGAFEAPQPFIVRHINALRALGCGSPRGHLLGQSHHYRAQFVEAKPTVSAHASRNQTLFSMAEDCPADSRLVEYREARRRSEQEQKLLRKLCAGRLPNEMVERVLEALAISNSSDELALKGPGTLSATVRQLLGTQAPHSLRDLMEHTLLKITPVRLEVTLEPTNAADKVSKARSPHFTSSLILHKIRTLVFVIEVDLNNQYQAELLRLPTSMLSLRAQLPQLHLLRLMLRVSSASVLRSDGVLASTCMTGFSSRKTYAKIFEELIASIQRARPGRRQILSMAFNRTTATIPDTWMLKHLVVDERPASEILYSEFVGQSSDERTDS